MSSHQHLRACQRGEGFGVRGGSVDTGGAQRAPGARVVGQRCDDADDGAVFEERQPAGAEVVEQRPERFGPQCHLRMQPPRGVEVERRCRHDLVHPAHAVDEDLFDQGLLDELLCSRRSLVFVAVGHRNLRDV
jgi:hypothetical protein